MIQSDELFFLRGVGIPPSRECMFYVENGVMFGHMLGYVGFHQPQRRGANPEVVEIGVLIRPFGGRWSRVTSLSTSLTSERIGQIGATVPTWLPNQPISPGKIC